LESIDPDPSVSNKSKASLISCFCSSHGRCGYAARATPERRRCNAFPVVEEKYMTCHDTHIMPASMPRMVHCTLAKEPRLKQRTHRGPCRLPRASAGGSQLVRHHVYNAGRGEPHGVYVVPTRPFFHSVDGPEGWVPQIAHQPELSPHRRRPGVTAPTRPRPKCFCSSVNSFCFLPPALKRRRAMTTRT